MGAQRLPDIGGQRHRVLAGRLAAQDDPPGAPIEVIQLRPRRLDRSQAQACDQHADRVFANTRGSLGDQPTWGARVKRLKVGTASRFSSTTRESLVADVRTILDPHYVARAREIATRMTKPGESVTNAADLLEDFARQRRCG